MKLKQILVCGSLISCLQANAQWQPGGNNLVLPFTVNTTNNYLGTSATNNTFMRIGVQGSQDIFIDNDNSKLLPADASGRLHGGHWVGMGRVFTPTNGPGAWNFFNPKAHLHIDGGNNSGQYSSFGNGLRSWMNTGTLYTENSDAMYVGLKSISNNFSYAMINWSDDAYGGNGGSDFLSFNFTGGPTPLQQSANGIELGRFNPTLGRGTLGVGNFQFLGASTEPVRRLEILDADPANGINANAPQLRTTYTYNTTPTQGIFTEFQTTNLGDMYFNTRSNSIARRFGFHDNTPGNTVEITANGSSPIPIAPNGSSGLRFTNMTSANTPQINPGNGVLSVNTNGDVIYVPGSGFVNANNGVIVSPTGAVQLGGACGSLAEIAASALNVDRTIFLNSKNFWFADGNNSTSGVGVGGNPTSLPFCNVGNTFEISANNKNPQYGNVGASGLRFTKLLSSSPTVPNGTYGVNSAKVLTVDGDGDVVLTDASAGTGIGNYCSATQNQLTGDYEIPMNQHNYYFAGNNATKERVAVGVPCGSNLPSKFNVLLDKTYTGSFAIGNNAGYFKNTNTGTAHNVGVKGEVTAGPGDNTAGFFRTTSNGASAGNTGVNAIAQNAGVTNTGGIFEAIGGVDARGIYCKASGGSSTNYAGYFSGDVLINGPATLFANQIFSDKNIKTNVTTVKGTIDLINKLRPVSFKYDNTYAPQLNVDNSLTYGFIAQEVGGVIPELVKTVIIPEEKDSTGTIINPSKSLSSLNYNGLIPFAISGIQELNTKQVAMQANLDKINLSDAQVKTNINNFNALAKIKTLSPVKYNFTNANVPQLNFNSNTDYGFVAQQLETVYPELVDTLRVNATYDSLGVVVNPSKLLKTVNYKAMSALLVRSVQEQQQTIDSLRSTQNAILQQLAALASQINACCSNTTAARNSNSTLNQLDIELSDKDAIVLNQNVPNPFAEQTTITYNVPASVGKAQIIFFNNLGQVIQTVDIKTRGKGKVNVFASDLSSGLYNYTLVADGKVIDSKKMVRE